MPTLQLGCSALQALLKISVYEAAVFFLKRIPAEYSCNMADLAQQNMQSAASKERKSEEGREKGRLAVNAAEV